MVQIEIVQFVILSLIILNKNIIATFAMGYYYSKEVDTNEVDHSQFITLIQKLSHQFRIQMDRLRESEAEMSEKFKKQVIKSVKDRQLYSEKQTMEQIVYKRDLQTIYRILISECQKILTNSHSLSLLIKRKTDIHSENARKIAIKTPIQVILFAGDLINGGSISQKTRDLERISELVRTRYTEVRAIQKCPEEIINYYKQYRLPDRERIKTWLFPFCSEKNISVSVINHVGHNFSY